MKDAANSAERKKRKRYGGRILSSWIEIADFVGRSVRTVRRWEEFYDFPIHHDNDGIHAVPAEIDAWMVRPLSFRSELDLKANRRWNADVRKDANEAVARGQELRKQAQSERAAAQRWHKRSG